MNFRRAWKRETGVVVGLALIASAQVALAQTTVSSGEGRVVTDGEVVRIESVEGTTVVRGDWRRLGARLDTAATLVELGAVEGDHHIRLALAGDVLFDLGSPAVTEASAEVLTRVAEVIRERAKGEVLVVGHTDIAGDADFNQRLSEERALEVIRWFERHEGIPTGVFTARGFGETRPLADNRDARGRAENRRVELYIGTSPEADVRQAAGLVTVRSGDSEVRITGSEVVVDDRVRVHGAGVEVAGVGVVGMTSSGDVRSVDDSSPTTCAAGQICRADCSEGDCRMSCSAGATCDYACRGGDCTMLCAAGATCTFSCSGGDCEFSRAIGSSCRTTCSGGDCSGD